MKQEVRLMIMIVTLFLLIGFAASLQNQVSAKDDRQYTYTVAICNSTNYCQDHLVVCNDKELLKYVPIENAILQNPIEWIDPRNQTDELCTTHN